MYGVPSLLAMEMKQNTALTLHAPQLHAWIQGQYH